MGLWPTPLRRDAARLGLDLPLRSAGPWTLFACAAAVAVTLGAALYPVWRSNRMDAVRAVRTG